MKTFLECEGDLTDVDVMLHVDSVVEADHLPQGLDVVNCLLQHFHLKYHYEEGY